MDNENNNNASSDVIIINCKEKQKPSKNQCHRHSNRTKEKQENDNKKKVELNSWEHGADKDILPNVKIKRYHFKCIINLKQTVCGHNKINNRQRKHVLEGKHSHKTMRYNQFDKDRIVPCCLRNKCRTPRHSNRENTKRKYIQHFESKRRPDHVDYASRHATNLRQKQCSYISHILSPVSSSPLKDEYGGISYEDISNTSLEDNKPTSYKNVTHESYNCLDSKIDTLIKRTKERERKMHEQSKHVYKKKRLRTSTPVHVIEVSSDEFPSSFSDTSPISIHSLSTVLLEPQSDISSPKAQKSHNLCCPIKEESKLDEIVPTLDVKTVFPLPQQEVNQSSNKTYEITKNSIKNEEQALYF